MSGARPTRAFPWPPPPVQTSAPAPTPPVDWGKEADRMVRALFSPRCSDDFWRHKLEKHPEIHSMILELGYQLERAEQLGRESALKGEA